MEFRTRFYLVPETLDKQLASFLKKQRGEITYVQFAKKLGITPSTLHRLENCQQSITLGKLEQILGRLKSKVTDVFESSG